MKTRSRCGQESRSSIRARRRIGELAALLGLCGLMLAPFGCSRPAGAPPAASTPATATQQTPDPRALVLTSVEPWISEAGGEELTLVRGRVESPQACSVTVNGVPVELDATGSFARKLPLASARGKVRFEATDAGGRSAATIEIAVPNRLERLPWPDAAPAGTRWLWFDGRPYPEVVEDRRNGARFVLVGKGTAVLGSPAGAGNEDEHPQLRFEVAKPFYLGQTEVTVGQWRQFAARTGHVTWPERQTSGESTWKRPFPNGELTVGDDHPATAVSWDDAAAYAAAHGCRLPTEHEWEYACRAGSQTAYWWSDPIEEGEGKANVWDQDGAAVVERQADEAENPAHFSDGYPRLAPVAQFLAGRSIELHDMAGNVREWCLNGYDRDAYKSSPPNLAGAGDSLRVTRGGSWYSSLDACRSAARSPLPRNSYYPDVGFRVARDVEN